MCPSVSFHEYLEQSVGEFCERLHCAFDQQRLPVAMWSAAAAIGRRFRMVARTRDALVSRCISPTYRAAILPAAPGLSPALRRELPP